MPFCPKCKTEYKGGDNLCKKCGTEVRAGAVPRETSTLLHPPEKQFSNAQPVLHFALLCLVSFGLYELFWFYKNWKFIKEHNKLNISPIWRAFFSFFFAYSLFKNVFALAKEKGYKGKHSAGLLTFGYIALLIVPNRLISLFSFVPLIPVVKVLNYYWRHEQPNLKERTNFSAGEITVLIIGGFILIVVLGFAVMP